ncbi:MAG: T9SS type A sorting domain-containing protein [Cryomorphaceae bacterium]
MKRILESSKYDALKIVLLFLLIHGGVNAQSVFDHSLYRIQIGYGTGENLQMNKYKYGNIMGFDVISEADDKTFINYNPTFSPLNNLEGLPSLQFDSLSDMTIFTIFRHTDLSEEKLIWSLSTRDTAKVILTDLRLANIYSWKFFNHLGDNSEVVLSTFFKNVGDDMDTSFLFELGPQESTALFPLTAFDGDIGEIIIFDQNLNALMVNQIESALSLKYGISLKDKDYICSDGEVIWNHIRDREFNNRIAGIGKDANLNLFQKQSTSAMSQIDLTISTGAIHKSNERNTSDLENLDYLIWGDDGKITGLKKIEDSETYQIQRKWLVSRQGIINSNQVRINHRKIEGLSEKNFVYLVVVEGGDSESSLSSGTYVPFQTKTEDYIEFEYSFDNDTSGTDVFSFVAGGPIIPKFWVSPASCNPERNGILHFGAEGPNAPFYFTLTAVDAENSSTEYYSPDNRMIDVEVPPGDYLLSITDAFGNSVDESFFVEAEDAPKIELEEHYVLKEKPISLNVRNALDDWQYEWRANGVFKSSSYEFILAETGPHECYVSKDGCTAKREFEVTNYQYDDPIKINIFPNPSNDGNFSIVVILNEEEDLTLTITDQSGRVIDSDRLLDTDYHLFQGRIENSGVYMVSVKSEEFVQTEKLIISR